MADDKIDFDDDDLDFLDADADFGLDTPEDVKDDRSPTTKIASSAVRSIASVNSARAAANALKENALPEGYKSTIGAAEEALNVGQDIYDSAMKELEPAKKSVQKLIRNNEQTIEKTLPGWAARLLKRAGGEAETNRGSEIDPNEAVIASSLSDIFDKYKESEAAGVKAEADVRVETAKIKSDLAQGQQQLGEMAGIRDLMSRTVAYQDSVQFDYQRKSLELQHRQFFAARDLLGVTRTMAEALSLKLDAVAKNTGLPDIVKLRLSENYGQMVENDLLGKAQGSVNEYLGNATAKFRENLKTRVDNTIKEFNNTFLTAMDAVDTVASTKKDLEEMGVDSNEMVGEQVGTSAVGAFAKFLGKKANEKYVGKTRSEYRDSLMQVLDKKGDLSYQATQALERAIIQSIEAGDTLDLDTLADEAFWEDPKLGKEISKHLKALMQSSGMFSSPKKKAAKLYEQMLASDENGSDNFFRRSSDTLQYASDNAAAMANSWIRGDVSISDLAKDSPRIKALLDSQGVQTVERFFKSLTPDYDEKYTANAKLTDTALNAGVFDQLTRRSIVEIIPGYLSRILQSVSSIQTGEAAERLVYSADKEAFIGQGEERSLLKEKLFTSSTVESRLTDVDEVIKLLGAESLSAEAKGVLRNRLLYMRDNARYLNPEQLINTQLSEERDEVRNEIEASLKEGGLFNQNKAAISRQFNRINSDSNTLNTALLQTSALGGNEALRDLGVLKDGAFDVETIRRYNRGENVSGVRRPSVSPVNPTGYTVPVSEDASVNDVNWLMSLTDQLFTDSDLRSIPVRVLGGLGEQQQVRQEPSPASQSLDPILTAINENFTTNHTLLQGIIDSMASLEVVEGGTRPGSFFGGLMSGGKRLATASGNILKDYYSFLGKWGGKGASAAASGIADGGRFLGGKLSKDIYVKGQKEPALRASGIRNGQYIDENTSKVITRLEDITGPVVDLNGDMVLTLEDYRLGLENRMGKSVMGLFTGVKNTFTNAWGLQGKLLSGALSMPRTLGDKLLTTHNRIRDVYVRGETEPRLVAMLLRQGGYFDRNSGEVITSTKDIKGTVINSDGEVVLSEADIRKGLVDRFGVDIQMDSITGLMGAYAGKAFRATKRLATTAKDISVNYADKALGLGKRGVKTAKGLFTRGREEVSGKVDDLILELQTNPKFDFDKRFDKFEEMILEMRTNPNFSMPNATNVKQFYRDFDVKANTALFKGKAEEEYARLQGKLAEKGIDIQMLSGLDVAGLKGQFPDIDWSSLGDVSMADVRKGVTGAKQKMDAMFSKLNIPAMDFSGISLPGLQFGGGNVEVLDKQLAVQEGIYEHLTGNAFVHKNGVPGLVDMYGNPLGKVGSESNTFSDFTAGLYEDAKSTGADVKERMGAVTDDLREKVTGSVEELKARTGKVTDGLKGEVDSIKTMLSEQMDEMQRKAKARTAQLDEALASLKAEQAQDSEADASRFMKFKSATATMFDEQLNAIKAIGKDNDKDDKNYLDDDGDGLRDGGWRERLRLRKEKRAQEKSETTAAKSDEKEEGSGGIISAILGLGSTLMGGLGTLSESLLAMAGIKAGGSLLDGFGGPDIDVDKNGKRRPGRFRRGLGGLGRGAKVAGGLGISAAKGTARIAGQGLMLGARLLPAGGAIASGLATAGGALVSGAALPIIAGAAAIAGAAYGGWKLYRYLSDNSEVEPLEQLRFLQYGINPEDMDFVSVVRALEREVIDEISYSGTTPHIDKRAIDFFVDFAEDMNMDKENEQDSVNWQTWFNKRFAPVLLTHLTVLRKLDDDVDVTDVDDELDEVYYSDYVRRVQFTEEDRAKGLRPYDWLTSPYNGKEVFGFAEEIKTYIEELAKRYDLENIDPTPPPTLDKLVAKAAPNAAKVTEVSKVTPASLKGIKQEKAPTKIPSAFAVVKSGIGSFSNSALGKMMPPVALASWVSDFFDDSEVKPLEALRMMQYGAPLKAVGFIGALRKLEDYVLDNTRFTGNLPQLNITGVEAFKEMAEAMGLSSESEANATLWIDWYSRRFIPVFLKHLTVLRSLGKSMELSEVDDALKEHMRKEYVLRVQITQRDKASGMQPYQCTSSPYYGVDIYDNTEVIDIYTKRLLESIGNDTLDDFMPLPKAKKGGKLYGRAGEQVKAAEALKVKKEKTEEQALVKGTTIDGMTIPVSGKIDTEYKASVDPNTKRMLSGKGVYISTQPNAEVVAANSGFIKQVIHEAGVNTVEVEHPDGSVTRYGGLVNLSDAVINREPVLAGEKLGHAVEGEAPKVRFERRKSAYEMNTALDPLPTPPSDPKVRQEPQTASEDRPSTRILTNEDMARGEPIPMARFNPVTTPADNAVDTPLGKTAPIVITKGIDSPELTGHLKLQNRQGQEAQSLRARQTQHLSDVVDRLDQLIKVGAITASSSPKEDTRKEDKSRAPKPTKPKEALTGLVSFNRFDDY